MNAVRLAINRYSSDRLSYFIKKKQIRIQLICERLNHIDCEVFCVETSAHIADPQAQIL